MSEANRVSLRYVAESSYGVTPAGSSAWKYIRYNSETLQGQPRTTTSNEIRSDRMIANLSKVGLDVNGGVNFEVSAEDFDNFMEAALCGTWSTNVLTIGTTDRSFSFEKEFEDLSSTLIAFRGMRIGSLGVNFSYGELVTGDIATVGNSVSTLEATAASGTVAAGTNDIFDGAEGIQYVAVDGATVSDTTLFKSIAFTVDNGLRPIEAMSNAAPINVKKGRATVTGNINAYFEDISLYDKLITNTAMDLEFQVSDGSKGYTIRIPNLKFSTGAPNATGIDTDVMQSLDFTALYEASTGTSIKITRF